MKNFFFKTIINPKIVLVLIVFIIQFYLFRTSFPSFKYSFILLYFVLFIYILVFKKQEIVRESTSFLTNYKLIIVLFFLLGIAFIFSNKIYLSVFKDIINAMILGSIYFTSTILIDSKNKLKFFFTHFINIVIFFALLISFFGLLNILGIYALINDSLSIDYNFALLPVFFGMISILYLLTTKDLLTYQKLLYNFLLCFFSLYIFLSGSRRGLIVLISIILILLISQLLFFLKKKYFLKKLGLGTKYFLLSLAFVTFFLYYFALHTSCSFKNKTLQFIGTKDLQSTKRKISFNLFSYSTILNNDSNFSKFTKKIWYAEIDPRDPDCGWGYEKSESIFPLGGKNVEIIPPDAIGFLIDSTSFKLDNHPKKFILIEELEVNKDDGFNAGIYCYVSDDFDGDNVRFMVGWEAIRNEIVKNRPITYYDLNCKGSWQKLEIEFDCNKGKVSIYIVVISNLKNDNGLKELKGHIIIAYPEVNIKKSNDTSFSVIDPYNKNVLNSFKTTDVKVIIWDNHFSSDFMNNKYRFSKKIVKKSMISFISAHLLDTINPSRIIQASLFPFSFFAIHETGTNDPIRNWVAKFISEDTTYYGYKSDLFVDTVASKFTGPRIIRWQFAWQIFTKEYNWKQKIFGGGFDFLNWYGYYFLGDKTKSDYPHNPFLHILLYSGVLGLMLYIFFMYKVFYYYIKYIKEYYILFIFFLITFFFTFFSGGSPFDPPIMGFFVILPFFIHSVHKRDLKD